MTRSPIRTEIPLKNDYPKCHTTALKKLALNRLLQGFIQMKKPREPINASSVMRTFFTVEKNMIPVVVGPAFGVPLTKICWKQKLTTVMGCKESKWHVHHAELIWDTFFLMVPNPQGNDFALTQPVCS